MKSDDRLHHDVLSAEGSAPLTLVDGADDAHGTEDPLAEKKKRASTSSSHSHQYGQGVSRHRFALDHPSKYEAILYTRDFEIRILNSDHFFNFDVNLLRSGLYISEEGKEEPSHPIHGLLGQTVRYKKYPNRWRYIEGDADQYVVAGGIFGHDDEFSLFQERGAADEE